MTCARLDAAASRVAHALAGLGSGKGDRVAVMLGNRPEALYAWFGTARAGLVEVPLNTAPVRRPLPAWGR